MKERQPKLSKEEAKKALQNAAWSETIAVVYAATGILLAQQQIPRQLTILTISALLFATGNAAIKGQIAKRALEDYPGIEEEK